MCAMLITYISQRELKEPIWLIKAIQMVLETSNKLYNENIEKNIEWTKDTYTSFIQSLKDIQLDGYQPVLSYLNNDPSNNVLYNHHDNQEKPIEISKSVTLRIKTLDIIEDELNTYNSYESWLNDVKSLFVTIKKSSAMTSYTKTICEMECDYMIHYIEKIMELFPNLSKDDKMMELRSLHTIPDLFKKKNILKEEDKEEIKKLLDNIWINTLDSSRFLHFDSINNYNSYQVYSIVLYSICISTFINTIAILFHFLLFYYYLTIMIHSMI